MAAQITKPTGTTSPASSSSEASFTNSDNLQTQPHIIDSNDSYNQQDVEDDPDPQNEQNENYSDGTHDFQFKDLGRLVEQHNKPYSEVFIEQPPFNGFKTRAEHNTAHRAVWQDLRQKAVADSAIPNALFDPPRTYIEVHVAEWPQPDHYCCPCDLPSEGLPIIQIRAPQDSEQGITKDMFLLQVEEAFYGRDPPQDEGENSGKEVTTIKQDEVEDGHIGYNIGKEIDRPVVDRFDYMMQGGMEGRACIMGHIYAMTRGIS